VVLIVVPAVAEGDEATKSLLRLSSFVSKRRPPHPRLSAFPSSLPNLPHQYSGAQTNLRECAVEEHRKVV
jgi:hypothetical protein